MTKKEPKTTKQPIKVLIVDDHPTVTWGLERLVGGRKTNMTVVATAHDTKAAVSKAAALQPDIILLDIDLGSESGIEAMADLLVACKARIVVLTGVRDAALRDQAVLAGARGIVGKEESPENILKAIEKVHAGELWLDRATTGRIFVEFSKRLKGAPETDEQKRIALLTPRELEIVRVLVQEPDSSIAGIAQKIHTSEHTLRNHLTSIYNKLGLSSRLQLHVFASKHLSK